MWKKQFYCSLNQNWHKPFVGALSFGVHCSVMTMAFNQVSYYLWWKRIKFYEHSTLAAGCKKARIKQSNCCLFVYAFSSVRINATEESSSILSNSDEMPWNWVNLMLRVENYELAIFPVNRLNRTTDYVKIRDIDALKFHSPRRHLPPQQFQAKMNDV